MDNELGKHTTHCDDYDCMGCSCMPECDFWSDEPNVMEERKRIIAKLENELGCTCRFQFSRVIEQCLACKAISIIRDDDSHESIPQNQVGKDNREALIRHINDLDGIIRAKNLRISELETMTKNPLDVTAAMQKQIDKAFNEGWHEMLILVQKQNRTFMDAIRHIDSAEYR